MNITLYAPNYNDDIEQIKQKYSDWVKNSNEVSQKFKDSFNPNYLCVDKKWKLCVEVDFNYLSVKTSGYTIDEKRYHVDAKFGSKIYSDGKYDYYRKEDYTPAHDEYEYSLERKAFNNVNLVKAEGDTCFFTHGEKPRPGDFIGPCEKMEFFDVNFHDLSSIIGLVSDEEYQQISNLVNSFRWEYSFCDDENFRSAVKRKLRKMYWDDLRLTLTIDGIEDAYIDNYSVYLYPEYEITYYGNKKYGGTICPNAYDKFYAPKFAQQNVDNTYKVLTASIITSAIWVTGIVIAMILAYPLSHKGVIQMYLLPMILMAIVGIIFLLISIYQRQQRIPSSQTYKKARKRSAIVLLILTIMCTLASGTGTAFIYSATNDKTFYHTPEIVGYYVDLSGDYSKFKMTVESCDKSGKIVINHTFYENKTTHSATWEGQITYKSADKLIVEIKTTEYTKMPLNYTGSPKTIEFIDNYSKIVYDYITMNKKANNN